MVVCMPPRVSGLSTLFVHLDDGFGLFGGDDLQVDGLSLVGRVGDGASERVGGKGVVRSCERLERYMPVWQFADRLLVGRYLVVEAALEFGALSGKFLRVERQVLQSCRACAY